MSSNFVRALFIVLSLTVFNASAASPALYEDVVSADPACRESFWKGVEALGEGKVKDAEKSLKEAARLDGGCFLAYILLSQIAYARRDDKASTAYLQKIPPEPPEVQALYEDLVKALRADDYECLAKGAADLVAAYPQTMTAIAALHLLARAQYYTGAKEEALRTFKVAFMYSELAPGTVPAYASRAEMMELESFAGRQ